METVMTESETLADRIWRQVEHGVDEDMLPTRETSLGPLKVVNNSLISPI